MNVKQKKTITNLYFNIALKEFEYEHLSMEQLEDMVNYYASIENFIACIGYKRAIDWIITEQNTKNILKMISDED